MIRRRLLSTFVSEEGNTIFVSEEGKTMSIWD
jgi:hypothetical protein